MSRCPVCSRLTDVCEQGACRECAQQLTVRKGGYCTRCGELFADDDSPPMLCGECRTTPTPWEALHFHSIYTGPLRNLILKYKFSGALGHATLLGNLAVQAYTRRDGQKPDIIVPVPLHKRRLLWRGFNQSAELSKALGKHTGAPVIHAALQRVRYTRPQTQLDLAQRQSNIKSAFTATRELVEGKHILLVDDVYTTGATLRECARTLMQAGTASINVFVLARALR